MAVTDWEFRPIGPMAFPDLKTALDIREVHASGRSSTCIVLSFDDAADFAVDLLRALPAEVRAEVLRRMAPGEAPSSGNP